MNTTAGDVAVAAAILAASLVLRQAFPIFAIGSAGVDDLLFVRLAANIAAGDWLGPYDQYTLAKGAAFPALMALNSFTGIPLKLAEQGVYLTACCAMAWAAGHLLRSRGAALACLVVLAFNPLAWNPGIGGRVVREGLYTSLGLWILALTVAIYLLGRGGAAARIALGAIAGVFWLTREEGIWLVPGVVVIVGAWVIREWRSAPGTPVLRRGALASGLAIPVLAFAAVVGAVNALNYFKYGVFRNNEFRSRDFQQAYGAVSRISHDNPRPYVLFPADARKRAYAASDAARTLAALFEGPRGEFWREIGCDQTHTKPCPEILAGWFMWALRDAASMAGNHASALQARAFYRTLGREINEACGRGAIPCGPRSDSLVPPWRPEYLVRTVEETWNVAVTLARLGDMHAGMIASIGTAEQRALFARMTNDPQATEEDGRAGRRGARMELAQAITRAYAALLPIALPLAIAAWLVLAVGSVRRRQWHSGHVLFAALLAAVAVRVLLLGFLEATSIPSNNMLYLSPAFPMALAIVACVIFLGLDLARRRVSNVAG